MRTVIRSSIGVRFWASSTTTWPKRRKPGSISQCASSSSATSVGVMSGFLVAALALSRRVISSGSSRSPATSSNRARFVNSLPTRPCGVSFGHALVTARLYSFVLRMILIVSSGLASESCVSSREASVPARRSRKRSRPAS